MKLSRFDLIMSVWLSFTNSVVLSLLLPLVAIGFVNGKIFLEGLAVSFPLSLVMTLLIPANQWGERLAAACKAKPLSFPWAMISTAVATLVFATLMSLCMVAYFAGLGPHFPFAWLHVYPYVLLAIYLATLLAAPAGLAIARKSSGASLGATAAK